jgi:hypothetical protein
MLIVRNSLRLSALVAALALAGCGSAPGTGDGSCASARCVDILNFRATTETFAGVSIPPRHAASNGHTEPGKSLVGVNDTSVNSKHTFQGSIGGQNVSVTCTVSASAWADPAINPTLVIQQEAFGPMVNCELW